MENTEDDLAFDFLLDKFRSLGFTDPEACVLALEQLALEKQNTSQSPQNGQEQKDAVLALKLQQQWEQESVGNHHQGPYLPVQQNLNDTTNDEALARFLEQEQNENPSYMPAWQQQGQPKLSNTFPESVTESAEPRKIKIALDNLLPIRKELDDIFKQDADVHDYTRKLGALCRSHYVPLDQQYNLSFQGELQNEFNRIQPEILNFVSPLQQGNVKRILDSIRAKGANYIEPETGMNMMSLLVKSWDLATQHQYGYKDDFKSMIIENLVHNIATGGGCDAGIAGRLIQPYIAFLTIGLEQRSKEMELLQQQRVGRLKK